MDLKQSTSQKQQLNKDIYLSKAPTNIRPIQKITKTVNNIRSIQKNPKTPNNIRSIQKITKTFIEKLIFNLKKAKIDHNKLNTIPKYNLLSVFSRPLNFDQRKVRLQI